MPQGGKPAFRARALPCAVDVSGVWRWIVGFAASGRRRPMVIHLIPATPHVTALGPAIGPLTAVMRPRLGDPAPRARRPSGPFQGLCMSADSPPMYDSSVQTGFIGAYFLSLCNAVLGGLFLVLFLLMPPPNSIITPHCGGGKKKKKGRKGYCDGRGWAIPRRQCTGGLEDPRAAYFAPEQAHRHQLALTVKAAKSFPLMQHLI